MIFKSTSHPIPSIPYHTISRYHISNNSSGWLLGKIASLAIVTRVVVQGFGVPTHLTRNKMIGAELLWKRLLSNSSEGSLVTVAWDIDLGNEDHVTLLSSIGFR